MLVTNMVMGILASGSSGVVAGFTSFLVGNIIEIGDSVFQKCCQIDDPPTYDWGKAMLLFLSTFSAVGVTYYVGNRIAKKIDSEMGGFIFKNVTCLCTFAQLGHIFSHECIALAATGGLIGGAVKTILVMGFFEDRDLYDNDDQEIFAEDAFRLDF